VKLRGRGNAPKRRVTIAEAEVRRGDKVEIQQVRVTFPPRHRLKPQSENFFRLAHSAEEVRTERLKLDSVAGRGGELGRDENPAAQWLAQGLDPRDLVDRRADDREVEAIHRANIAIEHLAEVEREIDRGNRFPHPRSIRVKSVEAAHCFGGVAATRDETYTAASAWLRCVHTVVRC
jgi:hypothetical protein